MIDNNAENTAQTNDTPNADGGQKQPAENSNDIAALRQDVAKLARGIEAANRRHNEFVASMAQARQPMPQTQETEGQPNPKGFAERAELEKLRSEVLREREEARKEKRESAILGSLTKHGVDGESAGILHDHMLMRYGKSLVVEGSQVLYEDQTTKERMPVDEWVGGYLRDHGQRFKNPTAAPVVPRGGGKSDKGQGVRYSQMSVEDRSKLDSGTAFKLAMQEMFGG